MFNGHEFNRREKFAYDKGYRIDRDGVVTNKKGNIIAGFISDIYKYFGIRISKNKVIKIPFHRFQAYIKFGDDIYLNDICVRHVNGNPLDNKWDNIEIGSQSDNMRDIPKGIRVRSASIASNKRKAAYSKEMIIAIKDAHKEGLSYKNIMDKFGISSKGTISYIVNNKYVFYGIG